MDVKPKTLIYFETSTGKVPFSDWFSLLIDIKTKATIDARLTRVRNGNFGNCEPVGQGVLELKIYFGPGFRVYFGSDGDELIVLLTGGDKSTQNKDIKLAQAYWKEYLEFKKR
jgi:putative addiction module killer protein